MRENNEINGFLRLPDVLKIIPVSKSHWWAQVKLNKYPKPIKLGPKITVWRKEDIFQLVSELEEGGHE